VWKDAKAVEIMKEASLADNTKVAIGGVRFFLGGDKEKEELDDESSDEDDGIDLGKLKHQTGVTKKTKKKAKALNKAVATIRKVCGPKSYNQFMLT
jgi:protein SDA1